ncbi:MAG TPA: PTS IIA-like nitrogen regulatory protein PtsN [Beijerinckiaceae bacterium]|nr:PTS IIA-like nitrogen regulatory protein PtsN [Beijerinckiaceae bacterium]
MKLGSILRPDMIAGGLKANSKKQALQELAELAARDTGLSERDVFDALLQRERLGSTGIGSGIAIPHSRMPQAKRLFGAFARLDKPIDFESVDGIPVDLVFVLLAPEDAGADHLQGLARVARLLRTPNVVQALRATRDPAALYSILTVGDTSRAA